MDNKMKMHSDFIKSNKVKVNCLASGPSYMYVANFIAPNGQTVSLWKSQDNKIWFAGSDDHYGYTQKEAIYYWLKDHNHLW